MQIPYKTDAPTASCPMSGKDARSALFYVGFVHRSVKRRSRACHRKRLNCAKCDENLRIPSRKLRNNLNKSENPEKPTIFKGSHAKMVTGYVYFTGEVCPKTELVDPKTDILLVILLR